MTIAPAARDGGINGFGVWHRSCRARALDDNLYVVAPNMGTYYLFPEETTPIDTFGGRSFIINYKGQIVGRQDYGGGSTYVGGVIDIEALRDHRARAQWDNWMKDLAPSSTRSSTSSRSTPRTSISSASR